MQSNDVPWWHGAVKGENGNVVSIVQKAPNHQTYGRYGYFPEYPDQVYHPSHAAADPKYLRPRDMPTQKELYDCKMRFRALRQAIAGKHE